MVSHSNLEAMDYVDVAINQGTVRGYAIDSGVGSILRFQAIPYAASDRFAPPGTAPSFSFLDAHSSTTSTRQSLSISCPASAPGSTANMPVIVFIHGGRYEQGHADDPWYQGIRFAEDGCVFVSVNYRYRLEGFLPLLDEDHPADVDGFADPNTEPEYYRGAEDIVAALQWVRSNISAFGGDPNQVTLMGQSAGGALAAWTLCNSRTTNLVHRAVILSPGFPRVGWPRREHVARAVLGGPLTRKHLGGLSSAQLQRAYRRYARIYGTDCAVGPYPFRPEAMRDIPLLIGTLREEFVQMPTARTVDRRLRSKNPLVRQAAKLVALYFERALQARARWASPHPMGMAIGDSMIKRWAVAIMEAKHDTTWAYEFHGSQSAWHCADLPLVFDALNVSPKAVKHFCGESAPERLQPLATEFHGIVARFARGEDPEWETYGKKRNVRRFDTDASARGEVTCEVAEDAYRDIREDYPELYPNN
ncbi:carboxylesterase family protein [Corynebacterium sp. 22_2729]